MIADLHAQARAIAASKDSLQDALLRARELSLETACAHAYTRLTQALRWPAYRCQ